MTMPVMAMLPTLLLFTRLPKAGQAKTRLIPALGAEGAAALQRQMSGSLVLTARCMAHSLGLRVLHTDQDADAMKQWLGDDLHYAPQGDGDLGARLERGFSDAFAAGAPAVIAVGGDCPEITPTVLQQVLEALTQHPALVIPAHDGGYCLLALTRPVPELFRNINWGTDQVMEQTLAAASAASVPLHLLSPMHDIDTPEDLPHVKAAGLMRGLPERVRVSVIIPTLNEAAEIADTIRSAQSEAVEVLVVDAGSTDGTPEVAREAGATVVQSPAANRGAQMNLGANHASGDILIFLHADTQLPPGYASVAREALAVPQTSASAYRLSIRGQGVSLRLIEWGTWWRCRLAQLPYGDQGLIVSADTLKASGGFIHAPLLEDYEWVRRMKHLGTVHTVALASITSGRRWVKLGPWRTLLRNQLILLGEMAGIPRETLAKWYRRQTISE